jgi:hypothetical protein
MNAKELIKRKFRRWWSDLQFLVMLEMGQRGRLSFMTLVNSTGGSISGIGNTLSRPPVVDYVEKVSRNGRAFYELTNEGKRAVAELFAPAPGKPLEKNTAPPSETLSFSRIPSGALTGFSGCGFLC